MAAARDILYGLSPVACALHAQRRSFERLHVVRRSAAQQARQARQARQPGAGRTQPSSRRATEKTDWIVGLARELGVPVFEAAHRSHLDHLLSDIGRPHQGVALECSPLRSERLRRSHFDAADHNNSRGGRGDGGRWPRVWVALERVQDPQNFGAILRNCFMFGVERVVVEATRACPLSNTVSKASAGAMEAMDVVQVAALPNFLREAVAGGAITLGTAPSAAHVHQGMGAAAPSSDPCPSNPIPVHDLGRLLLEAGEGARQDMPLILLLGNEGTGLSRGVSRLCTRLATIPMRHAPAHPCDVDSLNVSATVAILLNELTAPRRPTGP